ncbi:MAG: formylglycine-generating enzyme family protein [Candidatus Aminicenantes bacterium]|nr:formylglycine-generating enzyme family protein [Candidatus Aminicenantes bacterium]
MSKRVPLVLIILLVTGHAITAQTWPFKQDDSVPAELAWIRLYTDKVQKNPQGYWEAELMNGIAMVYIPAGAFRMGSPTGEYGRESNEGPVHRVFIKGIWIGKHEVTRAIWQAVMGGVAAKPEERDLPKGNVSYLDVQSFLRALDKGTGLGFRLPTEAEWEKCCRGGNPSPQYGPLDEIAWHVGNSGGDPHPVGTKWPNGFGLYDLLGNVWEWCSDWFGSTYYGASPYSDPTGPSHGKRRVGRGGGFLHGGNYLRSGHRNDQDPSKSKPYLGFRLVLDSTLH